MKEHQILELVERGHLPHDQHCQLVKQTHISWVLLCEEYAYKIKKPLKLSFLDFSTLEKRKYFCEQELVLNQRLTTDVYLEVLPISRENDIYYLGLEKGSIVDYAVAMRRLDNSREMERLLVDSSVTNQDIKNIAGQLVKFHQSTEVVKDKVTPQMLIDDFNDIQQVQPWIEAKLGTAAAKKLNESVSFVEQFIQENIHLINQRDQEGFTRDCHGDLHSGNIFLLREPVIFDCIEFDPHLRQIDILCELAFFCMDLEFSGRQDLSDYFITIYNSRFPVIRNQAEERLFLYYKLYRANVKVKINAIKTSQARKPHIAASRQQLCKQYFELFLSYSQTLRRSNSSTHKGPPNLEQSKGLPIL
ncbi:MAG: hypothetical protein OER04_00010 [Cyclobacteriaceae bacterium]|nr:hypothetical protein [Cyclobacteriaceae bacterium]